MTLSELCTYITTAESTPLPSGHKLGARLVCPEYSKSDQEIKTYPLPPKERIFALCWTIGASRADCRSASAPSNRLTSPNTHLHGQSTPASEPLSSPSAHLHGQSTPASEPLSSLEMHTNEPTAAWHAQPSQTLHATLCPAPEHFCYRLSFHSGEKTQLHTHDYIELAYVVEGEFRQRILGRDITFARGDLCLIDKNCLHQDYLLEQPASILFLGIANDMFSEIMNENVTTQKIISFLQSALLKQKDLQQYLHFRPGSGPDSDAAGRLEHCLCQLLKELHDNETGSHYICKGLLLRIFRIISTSYDFSLSKEQRKTMNWIVFEEISDYIKRHYATVTIQELVRVFHFQEDYFNRLIKSKTGLTYSAYVQQIRLERAEHMLTSSDRNVEEIAELVGYHNKGYFYKIFQEKYGTTPSRYRKQS